VPHGDELDRLDERVLSRGVVARGEGPLQRRPDPLVGVELAKRRAEPLRVGRVAALEEEAQPNEVPDQTGAEEARARIVADFRRAADERLLLVDPTPRRASKPSWPSSHAPSGTT
jgi:hypothetical protein